MSDRSNPSSAADVDPEYIDHQTELGRRSTVYCSPPNTAIRTHEPCIGVLPHQDCRIGKQDTVETQIVTVSHVTRA